MKQTRVNETKQAEYENANKYNLPKLKMCIPDMFSIVDLPLKWFILAQKRIRLIITINVEIIIW